jgi:hypothetical protein
MKTSIEPAERPDVLSEDAIRAPLRVEDLDVPAGQH